MRVGLPPPDRSGIVAIYESRIVASAKPSF